MTNYVARERKHKVRQRNERNGSHKDGGLETRDSNAVEIFPPSVTEKEERRKSLRADLRAQQLKISSKKQKRLEKYIVCELPRLRLSESIS